MNDRDAWVRFACAAPAFFTSKDVTCFDCARFADEMLAELDKRDLSDPNPEIVLMDSDGGGPPTIRVEFAGCHTTDCDELRIVGCVDTRP